MRVLGGILIIVGLLFCLTVFGAVIGIPMIIIGIVLLAIGGRRKTVITNVVQVSNHGPSPQFSMQPEARLSQRSRDTEPPIRSGFAEPRLQSIEPQPALPQASKAPEFEPVYEHEKFTDVRNDLTQASKRILGLAKENGHAITSRPESITVRKGDSEAILDSNHAVEVFGRANGYF
jgi:hypothetical protein